MALKNKSMYAILGILSISGEARSGYDIKKYSDTVLSGFWNENFGHIYPTLKKMHEDGLIEVVSGVKSDNKVQYTITEKGRRELDAWLLEDTVQQPMRSEVMLKLLFSSEQPIEAVIATLEGHKRLHEMNVEKYMGMQMNLEQGIEDVSPERVRFIKAVLRRGIISSEAIIQWCDETIAELQK